MILPYYSDLHLHLDGSVELFTLQKICEYTGQKLPENLSEEDLYVADDCKDLNQYLDKFDFVNQYLQTEAGLAVATQHLLMRLGAIGVKYAEIRFAPQKHTEQNLTQEGAVAAVLEACRSLKELSEEETGLLPDVGFILCMMRSDYSIPGNKDKNLETLSVAQYYMAQENPLVVGVDLAGAEALFPTEQFEQEFQIARDFGIPFTIHAGEAAGPDSIECALDFGAKRIGHGIAAIQSERLMERLAREKIVLEMCPSSNLQTKAIPDMQHFPIREFMKRGIICTINSDNMTVSHTDVKNELYRCIKLGLKEDEINTLIKNGINYPLS